MHKYGTERRERIKATKSYPWLSRPIHILCLNARNAARAVTARPMQQMSLLHCIKRFKPLRPASRTFSV
eukprot:6461202-Amphidinium_carterae.2